MQDVIVPALVVSSLGAAAIHLATAGEHDPLFGVAFLLMAGFQGGWALALILTRHPLILLGGVAGQGAIVGTWLAAHTSGLPFGPGAGQPEASGFKDVTATVLELVAIGGALLLLRPDAARSFRERRLARAWVPLALGSALFLTGAAVMTPHAHGPGARGHGLAAEHGHGEEDEHADDDGHHDDGEGHDEADGHDDGDAHHDDESGEHGHDDDLALHEDDGHDHADGGGGSDGGEGSDEGHDHGDGGQDGDGDGGDDDHGSGGEPPGQGSGEESRVVAGPFAESAGYATPSVSMERNGRLTLTNLDSVLHDVVHDTEADGFGGPDDQPWCGQGHHSHGACPLFWSPLVSGGQSTSVWGLENVEVGRTYTFFCTLHHGMRGTLTVSEAPARRGRAN
jgi:hypothetical protein